MLIHTGTQDRVISEVTTVAGSTTREGSIQSDSVLVTLWVNSVTSGSLSLVVYTLTDTGREKAIITFPTVSAPTVELILAQSSPSLQRFKVVATYTGVCDYEVYVRATTGSGQSTSKIIGNNNWTVSQQDVTPVPGILIAAALADRAGVLIKNWGTSGNVYVAETLAKATSLIGYPLAPKDAVAMDIAAGAEVYAVSDSGTVDIRIAQSGG